MTKIYFTTNAEYTHITANADISAATSEAEALAMIASQYEDSGFRVTGLEVGSFGDCWIKFSYEPNHNDLKRIAEEAGMVADDLFVQAPGTHPGGKSWWISPTPVVLAPILEEVE